MKSYIFSYLLDLTAAEARLIISLKLNDDRTPNAF